MDVAFDGPDLRRSSIFATVYIEGPVLRVTGRIETGLSLFKQAELTRSISFLRRAVLARNGLMVAVLGTHPIRHKNFFELTIGKSFKFIAGGWWIVLEAEATKSQRVDERRLASYLTPFLTKYLLEHRPLLLRREQQSLELGTDGRATNFETFSGPLWVSAEGAQLSYSGVGAAIADATEAALGQRLSPHAFRRALTLSAIHSGHPNLASAVLQHSDPRVTDLPKLNAPVVVAYGSLETPEFQRQSRDFAAAAKAAGKSVQLVLAEGYNHFEILETMANPYGVVGRAVLEQMKLNAA